MPPSRAVVLYRALFRAHKRYLPSLMKELGDKYVKAEFKLHKTAKPEQVQKFYAEWENYLDQIVLTGRAHEASFMGKLEDDTTTTEGRSPFAFGRDLSSDVYWSEEQVAQLQKLKEEAAKAWK